VQVDCDVVEADGGTRTASITGAYVALYQAMTVLVRNGVLPKIPLRSAVAAVSVGIVDGGLLLDLCYQEDFHAQADFNIVLTESGEMVELQGATEAAPFSRELVPEVLALAAKGMEPLFRLQQEAIRKL